MFAEIKHQLEKYPFVRKFSFYDDIANGNPQELEKFCDLIIKDGLKIEWGMDNAAIMKHMQKPLYEKLAKAGCSLIAYGMETPSHALLAKVGKNTSRGVDFAKVIREGKQAGIKIILNIMFGIPGETPAEFEEQP